MIKTADLEVYKGDSKDYAITVKDSSGTVIDITGYIFYMTVKENATDDDEDAKISKEVTSHTDPINGETTISLSSSETDLPVSSSTQKYVYDIRMKDTSNKITTLLNGNFKIRQPVTHSTS